MSRRVDQHIAVHRFIAHRQRVLDMKPAVDSRRSKSVPAAPKGDGAGKRPSTNSQQQNQPRKTPMQKERERKIQADNQRLLDRLIKISNRKPQF
uniref:BHLH domain-containing protein n=2 Tax=Steinernema glaseri TaxID=37863 RepID=A0A1I7XZI0_9BILA